MTHCMELEPSVLIPMHSATSTTARFFSILLLSETQNPLWLLAVICSHVVIPNLIHEGLS